MGWDVTTGDTFVEVEYDYFNGEHLIPIHGEQGERIYFDVEHHSGNSGSHGLSLHDDNGNLIGMNKESNDVLSTAFEETTTNYIVVRAINGKHGRFRVNWWKGGGRRILIEIQFIYIPVPF
ncbi:hypothetical protein GCM10028778_05440 [Barrientosiimonas marina]